MGDKMVCCPILRITPLSAPAGIIRYRQASTVDSIANGKENRNDAQVEKLTVN